MFAFFAALMIFLAIADFLLTPTILTVLRFFAPRKAFVSTFVRLAALIVTFFTFLPVMAFFPSSVTGYVMPQKVL